MAVRPITIVGHKALHAPTKKVKEITDEIRVLVDDMFETMEAANGVGLAANQVASKLRIFVFDCPAEDENEPNHVGVVVNPVLERGPLRPLDEEEDYEGCLSVPGEAFPTARADWAKVTGTDLDGNPVSYEGHGLFARCLQHETDHLDGLLYLDRLRPNEKEASRQALKERGWQDDGILKWDPATQKAEKV